MGAPRLAVKVALAIATATVVATTFSPSAAAAPRLTSTCAEDDQTPTPPGYAGWERSSVVVWKALEDRGGIVPDIEEDRSHAPPAWWRYPSPLRSAELLAAEARNPKGLYEAVAPADLQKGDVVVRVRGAGACGKMALVAGHSDNQQWVTIEDGEKEAQATRTGNPTFFLEGKSLRPEAAAFRIRVKKDTTLGHVRELERDFSRTSSGRSPSGRPWSSPRGAPRSTTRFTISSTRPARWPPIPRSKSSAAPSSAGPSRWRPPSTGRARPHPPPPCWRTPSTAPRPGPIPRSRAPASTC